MTAPAPVPPDAPVVLPTIRPGLLKRFANWIANEPVVHVAGTLQAVAIWFFTYVYTGWDPTVHQQKIAGLASAAAYAIAFIARQFVTPTRKL